MAGKNACHALIGRDKAYLALTGRDKTCLALIGRAKCFPCLNWPRRPLVLP
ncbi:unnamed protein product [Callosobruchus maculatus]|uniref:Uncharacterized protein n=1 Tax=Callosobruchus maculatus TaxID=64391 RepID=A0A653D8E7_CALMS|nr:unnamed protein product [Callosobruchus maculatus]